jgi:hypothetical protein
MLIALKIAALTLLWWLFFSPAHRVAVDAEAASRRLGVTHGVTHGGVHAQSALSPDGSLAAQPPPAAVPTSRAEPARD